MIILYNLFLILYTLGIRFFSLWNRKAKLWINGRKNIFEKLRESFQSDPGKKLIWMHCASLGEFEQGRPVLNKIKESFSEAVILITFFSPSGYEIIKKNKEFENVYYLPMDSPGHARKWINILKPDLVLWVKYEYWHYYLQELKRKNIPVLLISGVYRKNQIFFKWYGQFYRNMLKCFSHFFVQNPGSKEHLEKILEENRITVSGDTRCDRVINIAKTFVDIPGIAAFCGNNKVIVAGSTWEDDEAEWIHFVKQNQEIKFIIAPHEIDRENLADVKKAFPGSLFYSEWMEEFQKKTGDRPTSTGYLKPASNCLIIDNIGMLSRLYHYATITYIGGGFGENGLHNILEAAVYGKPVIFGPEFNKNFEAKELIECGGAISIESAIELERVINNLLNNQAELLSRGTASQNYIYQNAGATNTIIEFILNNSLI